MPGVDPAIVEALGLDPEKTKMASHGGSGFSSTFKISSVVNGKEKNFFVKTGTGKDTDIMFTGLSAPEPTHLVRARITYIHTYVTG